MTFELLMQRFWKWSFFWLDWMRTTIYEKHIRPNDPSMPEDYVTTSIVADPKTGRMLQVDVFSTEAAMKSADEREQRLLRLNEEEMKALLSERRRNYLK